MLTILFGVILIFLEYTYHKQFLAKKILDFSYNQRIAKFTSNNQRNSMEKEQYIFYNEYCLFWILEEKKNAYI